MRPLASLNEGKPYSDQIKPFNFLLSCHVRPLGHPLGADPSHFHLIAPYENNPSRWIKQEWIDQYTAKSYRISTADHYSSRDTARVKTYGDVVAEYAFHAESKSASADGTASTRQTVGLLQRRHCRIASITPIGKESNSLEEVGAGLIHSAENVYNVYSDPSRDEWQRKIIPALKQARVADLARESGLSRRTIMNARKGQRRPHPRNQQMLIDAVRRLKLLT